jgi:chromosome segregation protein
LPRVHLKAVKLRGFKSFVDPVELRLEPGVAVVVGPNGSGKSNISDAILWATGSLSPHELRAEKPDDVLFAGSAGARPVDQCEVELVFDNLDGAWPELPFSEVSLARRLHRGGEGQYLVNRTAVRRIDLIELLSDVGLGGGLRSVISQGSVETVLAAKPAERRALVEEAAGLGRFKLRRHRAELKLGRVATQVERARDLEDEVRKRLRPLALQATAAERAEKLAREIDGLRAAIALLDLAALDERRAVAEERRTSERAARRDLEAKMDALIAARSAAEDELTDAAGEREGRTAALYALRSAGERLALRREAAAALADRLAAELDAARAFDPPRVDEALSATRAASGAAQAATAARVGAEVAAAEAWARVAGAERARLAALTEAIEGLAHERAAHEDELVGGGPGRLLALRDAAGRVGLLRESAARLRGDAARELAEACTHATGGPSPEALGNAADEADRAARAAARERDDLLARAELARQRLAALDGSLAEREGLPPAARALAESGERLVLAEIEASPGAELAVAAALGRLGSGVVVDDAVRGLELVRQAQTAGLGSLVVLVGRDPRRIVESLPVVELEALLASPVPAVTKDGIGWDPERGELWFAGETAEALLLELEARRRKHAAELARLEGEAQAAVKSADAAAERSREAAASFAPVAHLRGARRADPEALERVVRTAERLDESLRVAVSAAGRLEEPLAARATAAAGELAELTARDSGLRRDAAEIEARAREAERLARGRAAAAVGGDLEQLRREANDLAERARAAAEAERAAAERAEAASRSVAEAGPRERIDVVLLERLASQGARLGRALTVDTAPVEALLRQRVEAGTARTSELGGVLRRLGAEEVELRGALTVGAERASALDVELARIDAEREEAKRRLDAARAEPAEGDDRPELAARAERLERRRAELGQVNPLAKEEYEAEKVRLDELSTQREDLERSLTELETLRRDLTETVEKRFEETFAAVELHFSQVVESLFPGGRGRLRLTDAEEEGGEPGIEVELRPAGKRVTRLSLLSGGEKALGAIAFLFSLFLSRPSPFYLLDEVEAALDDTNIGRFTALLREYAARAQFIVITHQKRTMEAADVLYGVTMANEGVSQIVSRRLPREAPATATA